MDRRTGDVAHRFLVHPRLGDYAGSTMKKFSRRSFLAQSVLGAGLTYAPWSGAKSVWSRDGDSSTFVVTLELKGGADVTQFCDPKINVEGHPKINHWADQSRPGRSGNLHYAPVADNEWLFTRFGADMLIINGVDVQTNSHDTGLLFNFCLLYTSPSPRDLSTSRMPSSA